MKIQRKPKWLRIKLNQGRSLDYVKDLLNKYSLNTVCEAANCPNRMECFSKKTATFMILGKECSRNCKFCNVSHEKLEEVDLNEPENIANATLELGLEHVVITSVTRDDLPDGGAGHFVNVINAIKKKNKKIIVEVLIPDFQGDQGALNKVIQAKPQIINHNMETVKRLYGQVRSMAVYERSLEVLRHVKKMNKEIFTKSGIMVGLGEKETEVMKVIEDLREAGCDFLTIGQYLAPSKKHYPVIEYVLPETFEKYKEKALKIGFKFVASGPFVRSSYNAAEAMSSHKIK
ncbi:MAG: lipoyl synthase [Marinisporobacter sp.]|jgi:lipoic acid synthetase|nr:lipoyl synthase [Marinisporobacter sp.]